MFVFVDNRGVIYAYSRDKASVDSLRSVEVENVDHIPDDAFDDMGIPAYRIDAGVLVKRTKEEMDADFVQPEPTPTLEERVTTLEQKVDGELADQEEALNLLGVYV